ncbi:MAG: DegV family protein [Syntrophomonadaceae bacterium]|jgi:DegV family protein with EDD domain
MTVKIITDSTAYIDSKTQRDYNISVIPLNVHFGQEVYEETSLPYDYFYDRIEREKVFPFSSPPSFEKVYSVFREAVAQGEEVLGIFISKQLSETFNTAVKVREELLGIYPDASITIIDSKNTCMALGLPVIAAAQAAQEGKNLYTIVDMVSEIIDKMHFYFIPVNLDYLRKGGRIGEASSLTNLFPQVPVLYTNNGRISVLKKDLNPENALEQLLSLLYNDFKSKGLQQVVIHHIHCHYKAVNLAQDIKLRYGIKVPVLGIGPVIGLHAGPGTVGIVYY